MGSSFSFAFPRKVNTENAEEPYIAVIDFCLLDMVSEKKGEWYFQLGNTGQTRTLVFGCRIGHASPLFLTGTVMLRTGAQVQIAMENPQLAFSNDVFVIRLDRSGVFKTEDVVPGSGLVGTLSVLISMAVSLRNTLHQKHSEDGVQLDEEFQLNTAYSHRDQNNKRYYRLKITDAMNWAAL